MGVLGKKKKAGWGEEHIEEIMAQNFPNLVKNINLDTQEAWWTPSGINSKRSKIATKLRQRGNLKNRNRKS